MGYKKESLMDCGYFYAPYPGMFLIPEETPEYQELDLEEINIEIPVAPSDEFGELHDC